MFYYNDSYILIRCFRWPLARWTDQVTNLGKIVDPVADKICMMVVSIYLIQDQTFGYLFFIYFILITTRDTFLVITATYLIQHQEDFLRLSFLEKYLFSHR